MRNPVQFDRRDPQAAPRSMRAKARAINRTRRAGVIAPGPEQGILGEVRAFSYQVDQLAAKYAPQITSGEIDSDELFDMARTIAEAEHQHIIYEEYLAAIIGKEAVKSALQFEGYDESVNAGIHAEVVAELKDVEQRLFDLKETYQAAHAELTRLSVTAPVNGVVLNSLLNTIGGVVRPGQTVLEIVPNSDVLIVEARVRPLDIDEVSSGQSTEVGLAAFKQRTTPSLNGIVANVAADALSDPRTGEPYYSMIVNISREELQRLGAEHRLQPGMPAEILIKTGQRTSLRYLLQPLLDSAHRGWREQ